jgi:hypothetical protein
VNGRAALNPALHPDAGRAFPHQLHHFSPDAGFLGIFTDTEMNFSFSAMS